MQVNRGALRIANEVCNSNNPMQHILDLKPPWALLASHANMLISNVFRNVAHSASKMV